MALILVRPECNVLGDARAGTFPCHYISLLDSYGLRKSESTVPVPVRCRLVRIQLDHELDLGRKIGGSSRPLASIPRVSGPTAGNFSELGEMTPFAFPARQFVHHSNCLRTLIRVCL